MPSPTDLEAALQRYLQRWPEEADTVARFGALLRQGASAFRRVHAYGHFTGSAWLVSADGLRVLLTHHRKLDRWLQLGGHADGDNDLARVALREAEEESGLSDLIVERDIFDLDCHRIPARGNVEAHWHHDARYVVSASGGERYTVSEESHALAWREVGGLADDPILDESIRRMANKWLLRSAGRGACASEIPA